MNNHIARFAIPSTPSSQVIENYYLVRAIVLPVASECKEV
jgi:hypothetical protein